MYMYMYISIYNIIQFTKTPPSTISAFDQEIKELIQC